MMAAHAVKSASGMEKWAVCPGSVPYGALFPRRDTIHSYTGSAAHSLGEHCLLTNQDPFEYLDETHPDKHFADVTVDLDMVNAVTVYVNHIRAYGVEISENTIECTVKLESLGDWAHGMFGTADFLAVDRNVLLVDDYKHGQGVVVEAPGNRQFKYYALGGLLTLPDPHYVKQVRTTVIQPRAPHEEGPVRHALYSVKELFDWAEAELKPAALRVDEAEDTFSQWGYDPKTDSLHPEWVAKYLDASSDKACQFCPAKGRCPALAQQALSDAMLDFNGDGEIEPTVNQDQLTPEQIAGVLASEKRVQKWFAGVAEYAQSSIEHGKDVTGGRYKLVAGRSNRAWNDEKAAEQKLIGMGFDRSDLFTEKFTTPAQAEKLAGKEGKKELADLISTTPGKPTLAPADDKRPSIVTGPEDDFIDV